MVNKKGTEGQTMIYKPLKIEQQETH